MTELKINEFVDYIYHDNIESDKKIVYMAVGSAHNMARTINGERIIEIQYDQQYPLFLRKILKKHPDYSIYIVLIDPMLENPCFTVSRKIKDGIDNPLDDIWEQDKRHKNIYHNLIEKVQIIEFREMVKYGSDNHGYGHEHEININHQVESLINISMANKWFTIVMEYTGRDLNALASAYDNIIRNERDHIFFGVPTRIEGGCYINLEDPTNAFITNLDKGYLTAFTPFNFNDAEIVEIYHKYSKSEDEDNKVISQQIFITFKTVVQTYKDNVLALFRRLRTHFNEKTSGKTGLQFWDREYTYVSNKYKIDNFQDKISGDLNGIIEIMSSINDKEFQHILNFFGRQDVYGKYLENKHNPDPYKMYTGISGILQEIHPK